MGVLRLAHVDVRTPDLELSTAYYTEVMGLRQCSAPTTPVYFKCWDEEDHHSLRLRYDSRIGMDSFTFRVERRGRPARARDAARRRRLPGTPGRRGRGGRAGRVDPVRDPARPDHGAGLGPREDRQHPRQAQPVARSRRRTCRASPRPGWTTCSSTPRRSASPTRSSTRCSGLRMTEQVLDANGHQLGVWLERSQLPARHRDRQRSQRRAAPLRVLARRLGPRPQVGRHPRLQRRPDRPGPDPARRHPRQHHLLLRPARHPQRGLHRRLQARPGLPAESPGPRTSSAAGSSTTRTSSRSGSCASTPDPRETPMSDRILRLQHVQIRVPDLELCTAYYTEVLGLIETAHDARTGSSSSAGTSTSTTRWCCARRRPTAWTT